MSLARQEKIAADAVPDAAVPEAGAPGAGAEMRPNPKKNINFIATRRAIDIFRVRFRCFESGKLINH
ncbi:MAG: hypothetical protein P4N60_18470 [Verrucomicrobiae bacterium]|nr:hypothetical protein [Verrucomicrobiae bacterium]